MMFTQSHSGIVIITFILFILLILLICFIIYNCKYKYYGGGSQMATKIHHSSMPKMSFSNDIDSKRRGIVESNFAMSYTISGEDSGLDFSQLRLLFKENSKNDISWIEKPVKEKVHVSFGTFKDDAVINGKVQKWDYDPLFYKQNAAIKNTLGSHHQIINKSELYDTIKKIMPNGTKYLPKCYTTLKEIDDAFSNNTIKYPLIIKKDKVTVQKGIRIVLSKEEYLHAIKELDIKINDTRGHPKQNQGEIGAMISEYISNPLLIEGKKFHIRVYFLLSVISGITRCISLPMYKIRTAKLPYINKDYFNSDIHLTGGKNTHKIYNYSDILKKEYPDHFDTIDKNLKNCSKIICMAMTMVNVKNFPESYAGYHLYGADIIIANTYYPYLLEINHKPGFKSHMISTGWDEFNKKFSNEFFSFILNTTILPFFGLIRPPNIYMAEFIGDGALTPFADILTGENKCILIPYLNATQDEINIAKNIKFFNKNVLFSNILENCNSNYIFLISRGHPHAMPDKAMPDKAMPIGYLVLTNTNYLKIAIMEEYQNRGIATAIIAQFLEIYHVRNFTKSIYNKIYIAKKNIFLTKIAIKLNFKENKNGEFEYIPNITQKNKSHINYIKKELTYKIINMHLEINLANELDINKYMVESNCQFVSFVYNLLQMGKTLKYSTGSRYNKDFIYQGAELKSTLNIKILINAIYFKIQVYLLPLTELNFFNKKIENSNQINLTNKYYIYDKNHLKHHIILGKDIKEEYYNDDYLIEEYYSPYLLDNKIMVLLFYVIIYISKNGTIKFFIYDKNNIITSNIAYDENNENSDEISAKYIHTAKKYDTDNELNVIKIDKNELILMIIDFCKILLEYDIKPYDESNSGFLEISIGIKFVKKQSSSKLTPIIGKISNFSSIRTNNILDTNFVNDYYQWIRNCTVLPHFNLLPHSKLIRPNLGAISKYAKKYPNIEYSIIEKLYLEFNHERTEVKIYQLNKHWVNIGYIKLNLHNLKDYIIEISEYKCLDKIILTNVIFLLMENLAAYYAPLLISLVISHKLINKDIDDIAFDLEFATKKNNYIRKCRL